MATNFLGMGSGYNGFGMPIRSAMTSSAPVKPEEPPPVTPQDLMASFMGKMQAPSWYKPPQQQMPATPPAGSAPPAIANFPMPPSTPGAASGPFAFMSGLTPGGKTG